MELRSLRSRPPMPQPPVECAQCGAPLFSPDWSEYLDDRSVRHLWACEACDYHFETLVRFPTPRERT